MLKDITMDTIVIDPDPLLREKNAEVTFPLSDEDKETLDKMLRYVLDSQDDELAAAKNLQAAVGIAAPQIGINKRICIVVVHELDKDDNPITYQYALVNPKIISHSKKECALENGEACLSIREEHPGLVKRHQRISIKAYDYLQDAELEIKAKDYLAIVLQHEIDHLNGILFYDKIDKANPWVHDESLKLIG